jgi:hypothetical protein
MGPAAAADRWRSRLHWLIPIAGAWLWFCTLSVQSQAQIGALENVENYALAVFCQLFYNWSEHSTWAQTIHFGYVDSWMWSGHRTGMLPLVGWIYGIDPGPEWLCRFQILMVSLGAIPAYGLGRIAIGKTWGGITGMLLYLLYPPIAAIALQDYQDLVVGLPLLLLAVWQSRRKKTWPFVVAALLAMMAREELIPMVVLIGLAVPGSFRQRMAWAGKAAAVAIAYSAVLWILGQSFSGYDNPMMSHTGDLFMQWPPQWSRTPDEFTNFYLPFLQPLHFLALLNPVTLLPALGGLFFHLTAPSHGGVDAHWRGHIHHMAPVALFLVVATIDGVGLLVRWSRRTGRWRTRLLAAAGAGALLLSIVLARPWMSFLGLSPSLWPTAEVERAPEWALAAQIPTDAVAATDTWASLTIANRRYAYTYDESLRDKLPGAGLEALDWILVNRRDRKWVRAATGAPGAEIKGESRDYVLVKLR